MAYSVHSDLEFYLYDVGSIGSLPESGMRWDTLEEETCSLARTVAVIGDRWSLLILRECFLRTRRFEEF